jgi:hypothetical protein
MKVAFYLSTLIKNLGYLSITKLLTLKFQFFINNHFNFLKCFIFLYFFYHFNFIINFNNLSLLSHQYLISNHNITI